MSLRKFFCLATTIRYRLQKRNAANSPELPKSSVSFFFFFRAVVVCKACYRVRHTCSNVHCVTLLSLIKSYWQQFLFHSCERQKPGHTEKDYTFHHTGAISFVKYGFSVCFQISAYTLQQRGRCHTNIPVQRSIPSISQF